ncbi:hypothetical protein QKU58_gp111 [Pyramimonas orientalis virus]|uniref:Uncharacterized protein n=1 Tax=Pyramimonas orientalis virus 01B TaxID=3134525 RepID=A0A7L9AYG1_9VIRU|nr:hypothetical protein QKU58_gp111 [Pyramimonas orientalis virus]QOI90220.1 hypothetical protein HWQ62_00083 [Pyramimonas orientalis virus]
MKESKTVAKTTKKGGNNLATDLANLSVPFGLILAQKSLEKYLSVKEKKTPEKKKVDKKDKKPSVTPNKKAAVSGGKKTTKTTK